VRLREVNWLVPPPVEPIDCHVKLRAREAPQPAAVQAFRQGPPWEALVRLEVPALAAPGQACVFYDGARVLGGGFICRSAEV
jgi:tRNA-specific 2-thiouridylase